jgi:hypothetical protein
MGAVLRIFCPAGKKALDRSDLEDLLEGFFGGVAEDVGAGAGIHGFDIDNELDVDEPADQWADQLRALLRNAGARPGTVISVYPDGWELGEEWRRIEVYGGETRVVNELR